MDRGIEFQTLEHGPSFTKWLQFTGAEQLKLNGIGAAPLGAVDKLVGLAWVPVVVDTYLSYDFNRHGLPAYISF